MGSQFTIGKNPVKMLVFLLASTLLHISSGQSLVTDLKISEHGANYEQRVEYDPSTKAVTYQVPKHHDILASTVIIHKPTDTMVELIPEKNVCNLKSVPEAFDPELAMVHFYSLSANNKTITPEDAVPVFQLNHNKGPVSTKKRMSLLKSMQTLCKNLVINEIVSITVSEREFQQNSIDPSQRFSNSTRFKRNSGEGLCNMAQSARYCNTNNIGANCQWTIVNFVGPRDYELQHIRSDQWNCVPCCKEEGSNVCLCSEASSNDNNFRTCQDEVLERYPIES